MKNPEQPNFYPNSEDVRFEKLTPEEERELFRKSKSDPAIREKLIKRHLLYVLKLGRRFGKRLPVDETTSAANFALMLAIDRFDPEKGFAFRSLLVPYVRAEIAKCWRSRNEVNFKRSVPPPVQPDAKPLVDNEEAPTLEQDIHRDFLREQLLEISATLPPRDRAVIRRHYVHDENFAEIGAKLGLSRERIRQIHDAILEEMRKKLEARGITSAE